MVVCLLGTVIAPGRRLGIVGTALMFMAVGALTSWIFVRRYRREYSDSEYWRLIIYCTIWAVSLEMFVLFTVIVMPQLEAGHVDTGPLIFAVPFSIAMDFLFAWLAFRQTGRRVIAWYLKERGIAPNQALEPTSTAVTPPASAGDRASGTRGSS